MEVLYGKQVKKRVEKKKLPRDTWYDFRDAFNSLASTRNFRLFDIKKLVKKGPYVYFRLRLGKYRALFHIERETIFVENIAHRSEVYRK